MNELLEKLKSVLEEKDLLDFAAAYNTKLDEQVSIKLEEEKKKVDATLKVEYDTKLVEAVTAASAKMEAEYATKLDELEAHLVDQLDKFILAEVEDKISNDLIDRTAISEVAMPIVEAIKKLFEEQYVDLDTEGYSLLKAKSDEVELRTKELSESIASKMELAEKVDALNKKLLLAEKTANMNEGQKKRISDYFGEKDFAYTTKNIDSVMDLIVEDSKKSKVPVKDLNENKDPIVAEDITKLTLVEEIVVVKKDGPSAFLSKIDSYL